MTIRFTCGDKKISSNIKNIMTKIVELLWSLWAAYKSHIVFYLIIEHFFNEIWFTSTIKIKSDLIRAEENFYLRLNIKYVTR